MSTIKHEYTINSVTALAFYQPLHGPVVVLAGEGAYLKFYEPSTSTLLALCKIFNEQAIHGIAVNNEGSSDGEFRVAIWGGRSFTILGATQVNAVIQEKLIDVVETERFAPDWILAGAISHFSVEACCVFITAHRATLQVAYAEDRKQLYLRPLSAPSQSILYSAHVVWTSASSIIVAAGTVFGEIEVFIWQMIWDEAPQSYHLFTFMGHEGSVFGVRISPEITFPDGRIARLLSSCSDDRTIRVWDLSFPLIENGSLLAHNRIDPLIRETGFTDNPEVSHNDLLATRCLAVVMAHASRIWDVDFLIPSSSGPGCVPEICIFSFGEDATCQEWSLDLRQNNSDLKNPKRRDLNNISASSILPYPANLKHTHTSGYHSGKHIWSAVLLAKYKTRTRMVTGGSDGKISFVDFSAAGTSEVVCRGTYNMLEYEFIHPRQLMPPLAAARTWGLEESPTFLDKANVNIGACSPLVSPPRPIASGTAHNFKSRNKAARLQSDVPNRYAFIATSELLISTSFGRLFLVSMEFQLTWQELRFTEIIHNDLKSYCLLLGIPTHSAAILAGANGSMYIYSRQGKIAEIMRLNGKPAALLNVSRAGEKQLQVLATKIGSNEAHLLHIGPSMLREPVRHQSTTITLAPGFIVTSATYVKEFFILGDRNGSLAIYDLASSADVLEFHPGQQGQSDDAVTAIVRIPSAGQRDSSCHFVTACRNGSCSIFSLATVKGGDLSIKTVSLALVHQCFPPLGPMIEAAWFEDSDLILHGFRSKNFVVWNESKECEVASIECGGAHRSYAYSPNPGKGGAGFFAYTKASKVYLNSQTQPSHTVLKPGGHGREIKACASDGTLIATGAEDTAIRIWTYDCNSENLTISDLTCCAVIEKHTTGIQHLQWGYSIDDYHTLFSAGGSEEFHVWRISKIPSFGIGVVCETTLPDKSEDGDLRIMGFEAETISDSSPPKEMSMPQDVESRITLIYSDSTIKVYSYSKSQGFHKTAQSTYTTACLKQIICLQNPGHHKFFTTATDGYLSLWSHQFQGRGLPPNLFNHVPRHDLSTLGTQVSEIKPLSRLKLHQSSILAVDLYHLKLGPQAGETFLLATTGDDNALCITLYQELCPIRRITVPSAHAAGITGVSFKKSMNGSKYAPSVVQLLTIGVDQRVKKWTIRLDLDVKYDPKVGTQEDNRSRFNMYLSSQGKGDDVWTSVADPAGLVLWRDAGYGEGKGGCKCHALVFGNGMEIFELSEEVEV